jgi:hypothetical protein
MKNRIKYYSIINGVYLIFKLIFNYLFIDSDALIFGFTTVDIMYFLPAATILVILLLIYFISNKYTNSSQKEA